MSDWTPEQLSALTGDALDQAVDALVAEGADAALLLQQAAQVATSKAARKTLRRGLHRLRSRGAPLEADARGSGRSVLRPVEVRGDLGFLGPIDPLGGRFALLIVLEPGGARVAQLLVSDLAGVVHLELRRGRRRDVRGFVRELRSSSGRAGAPVEVEADALRALLRDLQRDRPVPAGGDAATLSALLEGPGVPSPGEQARAALGGSPLGEAAAQECLDERVEGGALVRWLLGGEALEELARALEELEQSPLVLSELQQRERREERIAEGSTRVLDPETRERLARRLEETAALWQRQEDADGALAAVRMAALVREADPPGRLAWLRRLLDASIELTRARLRATREDDAVAPSEPG